MTEINNKSVVSQTRALPASEVDEEVVVMSIEKGKYFGMGDTGTEIWNLFDGKSTISEIAHNLSGKYDVAVVECEHHIIDFVHQLHGAGLVEIGV